MSNTLSDLNPEFWANEAQRSLFVENKAMAVANMQLRNLVAGEGDTIHRTILSYPASATYTPGSDINATDLNASDETLSINQFLASRVVVDDTEKKQAIIGIGEEVSKRMMKDHNNRIEQNVLAEVTNADHSIDGGNVGQTSGNPIQVDTNSVPQIFTAADTKLDAVDAPDRPRTAVVGGHFLAQLKLQQAGRATSFGDQVNKRGLVGQLFGWNIIKSNNLPYTAVLGMATNPSDGDTVTIAGVTFTFKDSIGSTAGNVHIGSDVDATRANFANALNDPATDIAEATDAGYNAVADEDVFLLRDKRRLSASNDDSADELTITGYGDIVVSETLTASADEWGSEQQDALFLIPGAIDMVVQMPPKIEVQRAEKQFADVVKSLLGFGKKTFADGGREMVHVKVDAGTSDWS